MKRSIFLICMVLCLLLCACADVPAQTSVNTENAKTDVFSSEPESISSETVETEPISSETEETTERPTYQHGAVLGMSPLDLPINSAYEAPDEDSSLLGIVLNEPFEEELTPTVVWNEGEYDRLYIIPKYVGTRVDVYEILWDEDGARSYSDEPVYSTEVTDGCIIYAALDRPEGMPRWYIEIVADESNYGGYELFYDGLNGTAPVEYIEGLNYITYISYDEDPICYKPVIYLYPEIETEVTVELDYQGELTCTYPTYENGWTVTAQPDGTLTDANGQIYNYLYWEGKCETDYDFSKGFCVKGSDTAAFLETALAKLGLNRKEANEFIVYWLPLMQENEYNVISFQTDVYTESAPLNISPAPDTLLRVFMAWYGSSTEVEIVPQTLTAPERNGFTVVEWGGSRLG